MRSMVCSPGLVCAMVFGFLSLMRSDPRAVAAGLPGTLDPTFSGDGRDVMNFGDSGYGTGVAIQPDGKILVVGGTYVSASGAQDFALARYNADGSLDTSFPADKFPSDGRQTTDFGGGIDVAYGVAVQPDGKIIVAGDASGRFALARYQADGSLDSSFPADKFPSDGRQTTDFGGTAYCIALQPDGKIVLAGTAAGDFVVVRFNVDGSLDTSFGGHQLSGGKQTTDFGGFDYGLAVAIQSDGKIVIAGTTSNAWSSDFAIARYNIDGSLDATFSDDGKQTTDLGGEDGASSVAIQADGKIVAVGRSAVFSASATTFALGRYNPDGSLDSTFARGGLQVTFFTGEDWASDVALQADGKIVVVGCCGFDARWETDFAIARYNTDGWLDATFSDDGFQGTDFGGSEAASGVALQADGGIVVVGSTSRTSAFAVARYQGGSEPSDTTPPETMVTEGPAETAVDSTPTFSFDSSEIGSTFECRVDSNAFSACSSPHTTSTLGDGPHMFEVRATDAAGNADPSPAGRAFNVDTAPPETTITSGPTGVTTNSIATISFVSSEGDSSFTCRLDGAALFACTSPYTTPVLNDGAHSLEMRATDGAGNTDPTPALLTWTTISGYQRVVIVTPGLVAYWRLGEVSGAIAASIGGTSDGRYRNGVLLARSGALFNDANASAGFDGSDDYVSVADSPSLHLGDSFTLEAWIKRAGASSLTGIVLSKGDGAFQLGFVNNVLTLTNRDSRAIARASISTTDTTAFHHVVATKSGPTAKLYIDGIDRTGPITNRTVTSTSAPLNIGRDTSGSKYFAGMIDEVAIYNLALDPLQIQQHFKASGR